MEEGSNYDAHLAEAGAAIMRLLTVLEAVQRKLHPPLLAELRSEVEPYRKLAAERLPVFRPVVPPEGLGDFHARFLHGGELTIEAADLFLREGNSGAAIGNVLAAMRCYCRALEVMYTLHRLPPIGRFFVERPFFGQLPALDPPPSGALSVGLHHTRLMPEGGESPAPEEVPADDERGGFALYIPESHDGESDLALVVALHGGSGTGREFIWTWLREARGRGFALLAPTSVGSTWSLDGPDRDYDLLLKMVEYVGTRWKVDPHRVLLTGLSDGASYTLLAGLRPGSPFRNLAPVSGVLHPGLFTRDDGVNRSDRRIYLVHGALDWVFPVETARTANEKLRELGADVTYREVEDLSHTYPREENDRILEWFDSSLRLPGAGTAIDEGLD